MFEFGRTLIWYRTLAFAFIVVETAATRRTARKMQGNSLLDWFGPRLYAICFIVRVAGFDFFLRKSGRRGIPWLVCAVTLNLLDDVIIEFGGQLHMFLKKGIIKMFCQFIDFFSAYWYLDLIYYMFDICHQVPLLVIKMQFYDILTNWLFLWCVCSDWYHCAGLTYSLQIIVKLVFLKLS